MSGSMSDYAVIRASPGIKTASRYEQDFGPKLNRSTVEKTEIEHEN